MLEEGVPGLIVNLTKTSKSRVEELKKRIKRVSGEMALDQRPGKRESKNTDLHQCRDNPRENLYG